MKNFITPFLAYLVICIIVLILPASDGYTTLGWKLLIGQIYAIPVLIIVGLVTFFVNKRLARSQAHT